MHYLSLRELIHIYFFKKVLLWTRRGRMRALADIYFGKGSERGDIFGWNQVSCGTELIEFDTFWTTTGRRLVDRTIGRSLVAWLQLYSSRSRNLLQYNAS